MIIRGYPPNFEQIKAAFPRADLPGVLFAYGDRIYNPSGIVVPPALIAHEEVHLARQHHTYMTPELWWKEYLASSEFRYHEELLAHAAEFRYQKNGDRNVTAALLQRTAMRLIAPLYNYTPPRTLQQALKDLREEIAK